MPEKSENKGLRYLLLEKKYPGWVYILILGVFALILLLWFQSVAGRP